MLNHIMNLEYDFQGIAPTHPPAAAWCGPRGATDNYWCGRLPAVAPWPAFQPPFFLSPLRDTGPVSDGADRDSKSRGRLGAAECGGVGTLGRAGCRQRDGVAERSVISASISAMNS